MAKSIKALYEDGVFKPLMKVRLKNRQKVSLTVIESEKKSKSHTKSDAKLPAASRRLATSHPAYRIVGLFKSRVHDLSIKHDKHLYR